eukprot:TRINITY_DN11287_c0_g2_i3.p1 TRINITY_DN11287_c0_g2~~TRINITY_DN11287_c0_g2_i3.p1  ORF type:complete len:318 (+),score=49.78 TRINITY_DN11287_c0_g2_i3:906-1859(+)
MKATLILPLVRLNILAKAPSRIVAAYSRPGRIVSPVISNESKEVIMVLQVENDSKGLREVDELLLKSLCNVVALKMEVEHAGAKGKVSAGQYNSLAKTMVELLKAESQLQLAQTVRDLLPEFHGFEVAELLFYHSQKDQLYTLYSNALLPYKGAVSAGDNTNALSFPVGVGISSDIVRKPEMIASNSLSRQMLNGEIDNVTSKGKVNSFLFAPLSDSSGKLNGILQLLNKKYGDEVDEDDAAKLKELAKAYGLLIERVREKEKVMEILLEFELLKASSTQLLKDHYINEGPQIGDLADLMGNLRLLANKIKNSVEAQ